MTLSTPPEERETREKPMTTTLDGINTLAVDCSQIYRETMGISEQLSEDKGK